jgi:RNA polymerase sigma-70 factor (ECF subfamily)
MPEDAPRTSRPGDTTLHVRRAKAGDAGSLAWLVDRLSPLLLSQARYRLGPRLARHHAAEDVVQETWAVALPRLSELEARAGRETPAVLRFLSTTVLQLVNNLARKHARRAAVAPEAGTEEEPEPVREGPGVVTLADRSETHQRVLALVEELSDAQRAVFVLRGIEQHDTETVARLLDLTPNAVSLRYNRALRELRARLPGTVFEELEEH